MRTIAFYCDAHSVEQNAMEQLQQYAQRPDIKAICAFTDIHYCAEKALPVGVAFETTDHCYPLITGKDIGCGVMYLKIEKAYWQKPFDKVEHYRAFHWAHAQMTDDGLGGGNHFLSIEEDDEAIYIICHTGTRDRGIALYQHCLQLTRDYSKELGQDVDYIHRDFLEEAFIRYYGSTLEYGYQRRKNFCIKTMLFLQNANYLRCNKSSLNKEFLRSNFKDAPHQDTLNGTPYTLEDSIHNHIRWNKGSIIHRKGSTELEPGKTVVIPLSMSRGSLLVKAGNQTGTAAAINSCAHGAGRKLSRFDAMKHWKTVLKEKQRKAYKVQFRELLDRSGNFPSGYIQEFDFAYKEAGDLLVQMPYLQMVTQTTPIVTVKYSEI
ncbi:RtcB family protein [Paraflavitalea sp. CAU 1676]|uniref:RtcB family protein n=1 Tax=Paraflavitalea sp. CAU 1676 TaxID=3032598 RepID=UPI0023D97A81|nr:RtcB family protein [Paraflavitalea sp. CAU 1676]MDF2187981.1 RtcB family protein [Paraflavitalea sp. CAU 1676]